MKDMIDTAIREMNQDFHCTEDTFIVPEELKSFILGKRPEDFDYEGLNIKKRKTIELQGLFCDEGHIKPTITW